MNLGHTVSPAWTVKMLLEAFFFYSKIKTITCFSLWQPTLALWILLTVQKRPKGKKGSQILLFSFQNTPMMSFYVWILFCLFRQPDRMTSTCLAFRTGHLFMSNIPHIPPWGCSFTFDPQWHAKRLDFSWVYAVRLASGMWLLTWQPD